ALTISSHRNTLTTMSSLNVDTIIWWLSPWLGLLTLFAMVRLSQIKQGRTWIPKAGFGTLIWSLVFLLWLGLTFHSLLRPSAVGALYAWIGMPTKAVTALTTAIQAHPHNGDAVYNRGVAYLQMGKEHEALIDMSQAIELEPRRADAYLQRAVVY